MLERAGQWRPGQEPCLAQRDQLVSERELEGVEDAVELLRRQQRVGLEVLLARRGVESVDAGRRCERTRLRDQPDHLFVEDHDARLAAGVGRSWSGRPEKRVSSRRCSRFSSRFSTWVSAIAAESS